jgi:hypothetical protein
MKGRLIVALLLVCMAVPALAVGISIDPLGPTSATPVTLRTLIMCPVKHDVVRVDNDILVGIDAAGGCGTPPVEKPYEIALGTFAPGQYRITLSDRTVGRFEQFSFVVRDANPILSFHPWVVPTNLNGFKLRPQWHVPPQQFQFCTTDEDCATATIKIGDVTIRPRDIEQNGGIILPSPHRSGLADVVVTNARGRTVFPAALYFAGSEGSGIDLSVFERVLFPVLFRSAGANGSDWRSEAVISNPQIDAVITGNSLGVPQECGFSFCRQLLPARSERAFEGTDYPRGVALLVPRDQADAVAFALRIRDVSREADGFGTEVPVVREAEMFRNVPITLLDVPADPRYRTKLRIYTFPDPLYGERVAFAGVELRRRGQSTGEMRSVRLTRDCSGSTCPYTPMYAELDLDSAAAGRFNVYVTVPEGALGWAFASVTNNTTQQVTIVSPDGKGGKPAQ